MTHKERLAAEEETATQTSSCSRPAARLRARWNERVCRRRLFYWRCIALAVAIGSAAAWAYIGATYEQSFIDLAEAGK